LFRERDEVLGSEEMASFHRSSGRERPARSTLSLVLDGSHSSFGSPIDSRWESESWGLSHVSGWYFGDLGAQVDSAELFQREISKFVHSNSEGLVGFVVAIDEVQIGFEDVVSLSKFLVIVGLVVFMHKQTEGSLVFKFAQSE
jgi:hypothetical protein